MGIFYYYYKGPTWSRGYMVLRVAIVTSELHMLRARRQALWSN